MKTKKGSVILISALAIIAIGVLLSLLTNWPVDRGNAGGDIAKSSRFSRKTASESLSMMEELVLNDEDYKNGIVLSYVVMQTRAQQFNSLVDLSAEATGDIPAFADVISKMNEAREMIDNVCTSLQEAGKSLETTLSGGSNPELGQQTNNAAIAYRTLQKQNKLATQFIDTADKYLKENEGSEELKFVRDQWVVYQSMTATLEEDSKLAKKMAGKEPLQTMEENVAVLAQVYTNYPVFRIAELAEILNANLPFFDAARVTELMEIANSEAVLSFIRPGRRIMESASLETENLLAENIAEAETGFIVGLEKGFPLIIQREMPTVMDAFYTLYEQFQLSEFVKLDDQLFAGQLNQIIIHLAEGKVDFTLDARISLL